MVQESSKRGSLPIECAIPQSELKHYIGGSETLPTETREENALRARCMAARMLGWLF